MVRGKGERHVKRKGSGGRHRKVGTGTERDRESKEGG